jgi:hypothetical protein
MWIVLFVAVWFSIARGDDEGRRLAGAWLLGNAGAIALHWTWFVLVPRWSLGLAGGDRDGQSCLLRWVIDTPILGGPKVRARDLLAANDQLARRPLRGGRGGLPVPPRRSSGRSRPARACGGVPPGVPRSPSGSPRSPLGLVSSGQMPASAGGRVRRARVRHEGGLDPVRMPVGAPRPRAARLRGHHGATTASDHGTDPRLFRHSSARADFPHAS